MATEFAENLAKFGASPDGLVLFDKPSPERGIRYLDLIRVEGGKPRPDAVVEIQRQPVLYAVDGVRVADDAALLPKIRRTLAFRGDANFVAVVEPGVLRVYDVGLEREVLTPPPLLVAEADDDAGAVIPRLAHSPPPRRQVRAIHDVLFGLLERTTASIANAGVSPEDALSLAGRALFLRFLRDRGIVGAQDIKKIAPSAGVFEAAFSSPRAAHQASSWLDDTFNGDLLPLTRGGSQRWFNALVPTIYQELQKVLHRADPWGQLSFSWGDIDFGHVPIGLLSQVYERHTHRYRPDKARASSIYYTPVHIAEYMVEEAFDGLDAPEAARVLDPAAGAGVFLVAAYRRIAAARWNRDGHPPDTRALREILVNQLAGFDVNEAALRLAALSLYFTALELDPSPQPVAKLRFANLRGTVLTDVRGESRRGTHALGSLGPDVPDRHKARYDVVVGNPPWTAWKNEDRGSFREVENSLRPLVSERLGAERAAAFSLPDLAPDLPFAWRSLEWCRRGGRIALAMHARLLFRQSSGGVSARRDLFEAVKVTGVLNGAALRLTDVWPQVTAPFCLLFAENAIPSPETSFYFVSPQLERGTADQGRIRVDPAAAEPVTIHALSSKPFILKTLFRGTPLDVDLVAKIADRTEGLTLEAYWRSLGLTAKKGYQIGGRAGTQSSANALRGLPELRKEQRLPVIVEPRRLPKFDRSTLLRTRLPADGTLGVYRAPLVLALQSPSAQEGVTRAGLAMRDVVFSESFIGYSAFGHPQAELLAKFLVLLLNSRLLLYYALMTSAQFGVERDAFYKEDYDLFPVRPLEKLSGDEERAIEGAFDRLARGGGEALGQVNALVMRVYGLDEWDARAISDTLAVGLPFSANTDLAQLPPSRQTVDAFTEEMQVELDEWLKPFGRRLPVTVLRMKAGDPWIFLAVGADRDAALRSVFVAEADRVGASQIIYPVAGDTVIMGLLAQERYWTRTRARLAAGSLLRDREAQLAQ